MKFAGFSYGNQVTKAHTTKHGAATEAVEKGYTSQRRRGKRWAEGFKIRKVKGHDAFR